RRRGLSPRGAVPSGPRCRSRAGSPPCPGPWPTPSPSSPGWSWSSPAWSRWPPGGPTPEPTRTPTACTPTAGGAARPRQRPSCAAPDARVDELVGGDVLGLEAGLGRLALGGEDRGDDVDHPLDASGVEVAQGIA